MQDIELAHDLGRALWRDYVSVHLRRSSFTNVCMISVTYLRDVKRWKSAAGYSKTSMKVNLIPNIRKPCDFKCKVRADNELININYNTVSEL